MRFILLDEILTLDPGCTITARKYMGAGEDFFADHFPGFPVVPGVLLTEMIAQAAGKCLDAEKKSRGRAMLARIDQASFRDWMRPGQTAEIKAEIKTNRDKFATAQGAIEVDGKSIATAKLFYTFVPADTISCGFHDEVLDAYLSKTGTINKERAE